MTRRIQNTDITYIGDGLYVVDEYDLEDIVQYAVWYGLRGIKTSTAGTPSEKRYRDKYEHATYIRKKMRESKEEYNGTT